eukprot:13183842-Alexandrium_andersonii.AAC.1
MPSGILLSTLGLQLAMRFDSVAKSFAIPLIQTSALPLSVALWASLAAFASSRFFLLAPSSAAES